MSLLFSSPLVYSDPVTHVALQNPILIVTIPVTAMKWYAMASVSFEFDCLFSILYRLMIMLLFSTISINVSNDLIYFTMSEFDKLLFLLCVSNIIDGFHCVNISTVFTTFIDLIPRGIGSVWRKYDTLTLEFDEFDGISTITNDFDGNSGIIHNVKCENEKKSETSQCVAVFDIVLQVLSIIICVSMNMAHGELISIAIYLFSCLLSTIASVLNVFDVFKPMNYYECAGVLFFAQKFLYFEFVNVIFVPNIHKIIYKHNIHDSKQILQQFQHILTLIVLIVQSFNVLNGYAFIIQVTTDELMKIVTVQFCYCVYHQLLYLSLLFVCIMVICATIGSVLINSDAPTLKFGGFNDISTLTNEFDDNNSIIRNTKHENEKEREAGQYVAVWGIFGLVLSVIHVLMDITRTELIFIAMSITIYLFSCLIITIASILAVFDVFNPFGCDTTMHYHECAEFLCFVENFLYFEFVSVILISYVNKMVEPQNIHNQRYLTTI